MEGANDVDDFVRFIHFLFVLSLFPIFLKMFESEILAKLVFGLGIIVFIYSIFGKFSYVKLTLGIVLIFLIKLVVSGELALLIHPRYFWLTKAAALVIFAVLILCRKEKEKLSRNVAVMLTILNIILVFSLFIKFKPLSASFQGPSNMNANNSELSRNKRLTNFRTDTSTLSIEDWLSMFNMDPEPSRYNGKKIKVTGFYYESGDGSPAIGKYVISCCAADARIMGIWLEKALNYAPNTWLEIEGTLKEVDIKGQRDIAIEVIKEKQIPTPKDPYATK